MPRKSYLEIEDPDERDKIILPSEREKPRRIAPEIRRVASIRPNTRRGFRKKEKSYKWILIIVIIMLIYFLYTPMLKTFFGLLESNPTIYKYYLYIESQIQNETLTGLLFISFLGTLFFLVLPSEAVFIYFLSVTDHYFIYLIAIVTLGNVVGMIGNYLFGRLIGEKPLKWMFNKNFDKYRERVQKYGGYVLLFGNILPGPIEVLAVFFGGFKFRLSVYIYLVLIGRLIKFLILLIAFYFFWDTLLIWYEYTIASFELLSSQLLSII